MHATNVNPPFHTRSHASFRLKPTPIQLASQLPLELYLTVLCWANQTGFFFGGKKKLQKTQKRKTHKTKTASKKTPKTNLAALLGYALGLAFAALHVALQPRQRSSKNPSAELLYAPWAVDQQKFPMLRCAGGRLNDLFFPVCLFFFGSYK